MTSAWRIALRNLARNRRRTVTSGLALAVGVAGISMLGGYVLRVESFLRTSAIYLQNTGHVVIYKQGGLAHASGRPRSYNLAASELTAIHSALAQIAGVEFSASYLTGVGLLGNGCKSVPFVGLGLDPTLQARIVKHPEVLRVTPDLGRPVQGKLLADYGAVQDAVVLSAGLARLLGKSKIHDQLSAAPAPVHLPDCTAPAPERDAELATDANVQLLALAYDGTLSAQDGEIVSTIKTPLAATDDLTLVTSLDKLRALFNTDTATYVAVFLKPGEDVPTLTQRIDARLRAAGLRVAVYPFDDERINPYYAGNMAMLLSIFGFFSVLVTCVVALSVINAMTLNVIERTRELGTFRALGFTRRQLLSLFVRESMLLALGGATTGVAIAALCAWAVNGAKIRIQPPGVTDQYQIVIATSPALSAVICTALFALCVLATFSTVRRRVQSGITQLLTDTAS